MEDGSLKDIPQIVYLDFDGESTVYRNNDLNIAIAVDVEDSGMSEEQKQYILAELSARYALEDIVFTTEKPNDTAEYSTIFIGQTDDFEEYGSFAGLAETIDQGNLIKNDNAFVLADYTCDTDLVISVIDHELGHIFEGMEHEYVSGDINDFAGSYHLYGSSLSLGTISCPATITGCVSGATFDTYNYTSSVSFSVAQSGYYTVLLRAQHASGGSTTVSGRVSGPGIEDSITLGKSASFYFTAGETYSIQVSIPMLAATNFSSVYNYTCTITSGSSSNRYDLRTYTPSNWSAPLVVSNRTNTNTSSSSFTTDDNIYLDFAVLNDSDSTISKSFTTAIYIDDVLWGSWTATDLKSQYYTGVEDLDLGKFSAGTHTIKLVADSTGTITETNENNNTYTTTFTVAQAAKPDLTISSFSVSSSSVTTSDALTISFTVKNNGTSSASSSYVYLYDGGLKVAQISVGTLSASGSKSLSYTFDAGDLAVGTHSFYVKADGGLSIAESNENNNTSSTKSVTVVQAGKPDLTFFKLPDWSDALIIATEKGTRTDSTVFTDEDDIYIDFAVRNMGDGDAQAFSTAIYVDNVLQKILNFDPLAVKYTFAKNDYSLGKLSVGTHTIKIVTDYNNKNSESNENNNIYTKTITVVQAADTESPTTPGNLVCSMKNGSAYLDWDDSSDNVGVVRYELHYVARQGSGKPDFSKAVVCKSTTSSLSLGNMAEGEYYYRLFAVDAAGNYSSDTAYRTFTVSKTSDTVPAISGLSYRVKDGNLIIDWDDIDSDIVSGYQVKRYSEKTGGREPVPVNLAQSQVSFSLESVINVLSFDIRAIGKNNLYSHWVGNEFEVLRESNYEIFLWYMDRLETTVTISPDNFAHGLTLKPSTGALDLYSLPGDISWISEMYDDYPEEVSKSVLVADRQFFEGIELVSDADGNEDLFFANAKGTWEENYAAEHHGFLNGWGGTMEQVLLSGINKITDVFMGSKDANILVLTDDVNGDALFVDDVFTALGKDGARISQIDEIRAGAGNDVIDLTSQKFAYIGDEMTIYGGAGDDTIWANSNINTLCGDGGNDRIIGGSGNDIIIGGSGNDSMHGGGGDDIFCFGGNWGNDTVEQLANGRITLWFKSGSRNNWNSSTLTYSYGGQSVQVSGISNDRITLKFGDDASLTYDDLVVSGGFEDAASEKIFEDKNSGMLA